MAVNRADVIDQRFKDLCAALPAAPPRDDWDSPVREGSGLSARGALQIYESMLSSRHLDFAARAMRAKNQGFYTIGSSGHEGNAAALDLVRGGFAQFGRSVEDVPVVFLMNKRDLPGIASEEELRAAFRTERCAHVASVAPRGEGVAEALRALVAMMAT